jgi:hypothetical protein
VKIVSLQFDDDGEADQFAAAARARGADGLPMISYLPKDQADAPWLKITRFRVPWAGWKCCRRRRNRAHARRHAVHGRLVIAGRRPGYNIVALRIYPAAGEGPPADSGDPELSG